MVTSEVERDGGQEGGLYIRSWDRAQLVRQLIHVDN